MKKTVIGILFTAFMILTGVCYAEESTSLLSIGCDKLFVAPNESITVSINNEKAFSFRGAQFKFTYDDTKLDLLGIENGEVFSSSTVNKIKSDKKGIINIAFAYLEDGENLGEIIKATFKVKESPSLGDLKFTCKDIIISSGNETSGLNSDITLSVRVEKPELIAQNKETGKSNDSTKTDNEQSDKSNESTVVEDLIENNSIDKKVNENLPQNNNTKTNSGSSSKDILLPAINTEPNPKIKNKLFYDLTGHWGEADIMYLYEKGIVNGVEENYFQPNRQITRAEFAKIIVEYLQLSYGEATGFRDVNKSDWFYGSVGAAYASEIMTGDNNMFRPNDSITREEMAVIIDRLFKKNNTENIVDNSILNTFNDCTQISSWARDSLICTISIGIINGTSKNTISPKSSATRAEACAVIKRLEELQQK